MLIYEKWYFVGISTIWKGSSAIYPTTKMIA